MNYLMGFFGSSFFAFVSLSHMHTQFVVVLCVDVELNCT